MSLTRRVDEVRYCYTKGKRDELTIANYISLFSSGQRVAFIGKKLWLSFKKIQRRMAFSRLGFYVCHKCKVLFCHHPNKTTLHQYQSIRSLKKMFIRYRNSDRRLQKGISAFFNDWINIDLNKDHVLTILPFNCNESCHDEQPKVQITDLFEEELVAESESIYGCKTQTSNDEPSWIKEFVYPIEREANDEYWKMIKGKYLHLENEDAIESFKYRLKIQMNRVRYLYSKARVGIETYEDLRKELDNVKLTLHQYVLPENIQERLERFREKLEKHMAIYARTHLRDFFIH